MNLIVLRNELDADPLARGYSAMTDAEAAADLNTVYCTCYAETLPSAVIYEATVASEFQALTDVQKSYIRDVWGLGEGVYIGAGSNARATYQNIFGTGSGTWAALVAAAQEDVSRGEELGLGIVREADVMKARAL